MCPNNTFQCHKNHRCIQKKYVCDGYNDCGDASDERLAPAGPCVVKTCNSTQFKCDVNNCIDKSWVCDGHNDCEDASDEDPERCKGVCPSRNKFSCAVSKKCISKTLRCNGHQDCGPNDNSDEENCGKIFCCYFFMLIIYHMKT